MQEEPSWQELKEIWGNSAKGAKINVQISKLINELKGKISPFEKKSIQSDLNILKASWAKEKNKVSQFEKDSVKKDLKIMKSFFKRFLSKLPTKKD